MQKKIIFLASCPLSLINFRLHLMQEFLARNYQVVAIAPFDAEIKKQLTILNIKFIATPLARNGINPFKDLWHIVKLFRLIKKEDPELILSYTIKPVIYGSFTAKLAQVPYIYSMITGTGYAFTESNFISKIIGLIAKKMLRFTLKMNHKVFFQNKDNADLFNEKKLIKMSEQAVIINGSGVDLKFYQRADLPIELSFLLIARLIADKGIREYVTAAKVIKGKYPHLRFKLAGWIDTNPHAISEQELQTWIKEGTIEYLGRLKDVRETIAQASVFVLPSYSEGTPRTVLEAMAMGRPIITTHAPGCKETVVHGVNGLLIPIRDSQALVAAMQYFIDFPNKITEMAEQSYALVNKKYNVHQVNQEILKAMQIA